MNYQMAVNSMQKLLIMNLKNISQKKCQRRLMSTQNENLPTAQSKNKPYVFAQRPDDDYTCIKLTEGKYKDIIYKYGNVGFKPVEDDEKMSVIFDYNIMKNPNDVDIDEEEDWKLAKLLFQKKNSNKKE